MIDVIGGITSFLVHSALDALTERHKVISNNIANSRTQGFSPERLEFEAQLQRFSALSLQPGNEAKLMRQFQDFEADLTDGRITKRHSGAKVELDQEMAKLTDNLLRYQALLEGMSKRSAVLKMAIKGGSS